MLYFCNTKENELTLIPRLKKLLIITLLVLLGKTTYSQRVGIGEWDSHFTFTNMYDVAEGDKKVMWISELSAIYFDQEDNTVNPFNKIHGLTQTGFTRIAFNTNANSFVIGYNDGNLDLVSFDDNNKPQVINMSDIKRSSITGDKRIYHLFPYNNYVYVSCGFGIVVIDVVKQEVTDTYMIGPSSSQIQVNGVCIGNDSIFAATENGMYKAWLHEPFLNASSNWAKDFTLPNWLENKTFKNPDYIGGKLFIIPDYPGFGQDTAYYKQGGIWQKIPVLNGLDFRDFHTMSTGNMTVVTSGNTSVFTPSFTLVNDLYSLGGIGMVANNGLFGSDGYYYIADAFQGPYRCLHSFDVQSLRPGGTFTSAVRQMAIEDGELWVAAGNVEGTIFTNSYNSDYLSIKKKDEWVYINRGTDPVLADTTYDLLDVAIDPTDPTHVFAATWAFNALVEIKDYKVVAMYDEQNSDGALNTIPSYVGWCGAATVDFDKDGNLWAVNGRTGKPLVVKTKDGQWKNFYCGPEAAERTYFDMRIDENNYIYIPVPTRGATGGGLVVYDHNGTITDDSDDQYAFYGALSGKYFGLIEDVDIRSVGIDLDGEVWIGSAQGIHVIYNPLSIFSSSPPEAQRILIEQDGNIQVLLETEIVNCIQVDGANRKWIGTVNSGVYLLSEDGQEQIEHFTIDNSPLPSNNISDIKIDGRSGEVYFATTNGLISYRGTATESNINFDNINIFPNPVRPEYEGVVAINGISRNSDVKVTDVAGNIVTVLKSLGGQAIWDVNNLKGQRVKPGVYLFMCASEDGSDKVAGKVLVID